MSSALGARLAGLALTIGLALVHLATGATANVTIETVVPRGDGSVDLVLVLAGGCAGSGTVEVLATMPENAALLAVEDPPGWSHDVDGREISWQGPAVRGRDRARLTLTTRIDAAPGEVVVVPTTQVCRDGTELSTSGPDGRAPSFVAISSTVDPSLRTAPADTNPGGAGPVALTVSIVGFVGLVLAALLARRRRLSHGVSG